MQNECKKMAEIEGKTKTGIEWNIVGANHLWYFHIYYLRIEHSEEYTMQ